MIKNEAGSVMRFLSEQTEPFVRVFDDSLTLTVNHKGHCSFRLFQLMVLLSLSFTTNTSHFYYNEQHHFSLSQLLYSRLLS